MVSRVNKIIGGIGISSSNPLNFPDIIVRITTTKPDPIENNKCPACSAGRCRQYKAIVPIAIARPPNTTRKSAEIPIASFGKCPMIFSLTNFGTALKIMPTSIKTDPIIVNARLVSTLPPSHGLNLLVSNSSNLNMNVRFQKQWK